MGGRRELCKLDLCNIEGQDQEMKTPERKLP